jgi:hypothetical protein
MFMTVDMLAYLPLIDIGLTDHQAALLQGANQFQSIPDYIEGLDCFAPSGTSSPYSFKCGNLLKTAQKELLVLVIISLMSGLSCVLSSLPNDPQTDHPDFGIALNSTPVKLFVSVSLGLVTKVLIFLIYVRSMTLEFYISLVLSILTLVAYVVAGYKLTVLALSSSHHPAFDKLKPSKLSKLYYALVILHRLIYSVATAAFDFPAVQLSVLSCTTLAVRHT